jgi:hypothetical protein
MERGWGVGRSPYLLPDPTHQEELRLRHTRKNAHTRWEVPLGLCQQRRNAPAAAPRAPAAPVRRISIRLLRYFSSRALGFPNLTAPNKCIPQPGGTGSRSQVLYPHNTLKTSLLVPNVVSEPTEERRSYPETDRDTSSDAKWRNLHGEEKWRKVTSLQVVISLLIMCVLPQAIVGNGQFKT